LEYTAPHGTALHHTAPHGNALHHTAPHCTTLHHTAPHSNVLQHTATRCNRKGGGERDTHIFSPPTIKSELYAVEIAMYSVIFFGF